MSALPVSQPFDANDPVFRAHEGGKLGVHATSPLRNAADLSLLYTPGVAEVSRAIAADPALATRYTTRRNTVAVVSDGTAVLGLGDIGPLAAMPVMEGKAVLFKHFADVDAVPVCLETGTVEEIVEAVARFAPTYGGINLEDISAPRCFEIERRLKERLDIPVFHDDQHGTAIVALAALLNAAQVVEKRLGDLTVVVSGAGAAGVAVSSILVSAGVGDVIVTDSRGILGPDRTDLPEHKDSLRALTNLTGRVGDLGDALEGSDVYIGVSGGTVPERDLMRMAPRAIIFALANPDPEVHPRVAHKFAEVVATGRSDFPNQINNVLAFPGIFRGALDSGARAITEEMKLAAARAIADLVDEPSADHIVPSVFDERVASRVADAVSLLARRGG
ncbi:NADP-dependent malic enzyme [Intrasporangium sp. DVR]|uniref:NAD(P)-dependent malic enzyme n=1 Tax=Intrasporangium sp. DVR TaxID=3127867 RepID=UPI00313A55FB